jgi:ligand-binding sensor domain-containing protein/AraC-like DNA-binding protein
MQHRKQIVTIVFACFVFCGYGQKNDYLTFENIAISAESSGVNCFAQDSNGLIWIGSHKGLYSYDGFSAQPHISEETNTRIYCLLVPDENRLCFGTDNGVFFYNYKSGRYEKSPVSFPADVRTMVACDSMIWIGSLNGLFRYNIRSGKIENITAEKNSGIPHKTIYSIIKYEDNLYIGTYNGLCRYRTKTDTFEKIELPVDSGRSNQFANYLLEDTLRQCIWIGMEGALFKHFPATNRTESLKFFRNNSVKSLALDRNKNLLAGTDNGLYIYNERDGSVQHIVHDSRNGKSLSNNIIWGIFSDREQNIWLGTDYNISLVRQSKAFRSIPISQITGVGDGNRFHALFRDSRGNFWMGGTNGLIFAPSLDNPASSVWYQMGDARFPVSHNRIRHIYEDRTGNLWIASDGSISRYDYREKQFIRYALVDSAQTYNSNWAYYLFEDDKNRLWIATCLGGIFVVDKQKLMQSQGRYVAEKNFNIQNGLPGSFVNQIIPDKEGNVWSLLYKNGIVKIDIKNDKIKKIHLKHETGNNHPNYLLSDNEGFMWIGFSDGLVRMNPNNEEAGFIRLNTFEDSEILSMTEEGQHLWITTTEGVWALDKRTLELRRLNITNQLFSAGFYDKSTQTIYLGASDLLVSFPPSLLNQPETNFPIMLTAFYVNGEPYHSGNLSIRYMRDAKLNHKQNNLSFEFSNLQYSSEQENKFVYRLEGIDKQWKIPKLPQVNRISYPNLGAGKYRLFISKLDSSGNPGKDPFVFSFIISPPWYYSLVAKCIYIFLIVGFMSWIIIFFRMRNKSVFSSHSIENPAVPKPVEANNPPVDKLLSGITQIIEDHIADTDLNVNALSHLSGTGSKQIYRKTKQLTGMSPVEYIRSLRMKKAATLLSENKYTVSEVMYKVGFSSSSYFAKCFQAEFGKSPKEYIPLE